MVPRLDEALFWYARSCKVLSPIVTNLMRYLEAPGLCLGVKCDGVMSQYSTFTANLLLGYFSSGDFLGSGVFGGGAFLGGAAVFFSVFGSSAGGGAR
jgi:hypothetical protein